MTRDGNISQNNRQNRKSQNQPSNVSEFSKALCSHFSVHKMQRISKLIARNSHLALKAAITSLGDVTIIILTSAQNRDVQGILLLLMQNYDKVVA